VKFDQVGVRVVFRRTNVTSWEEKKERFDRDSQIVSQIEQK